MIFNLNFVHYSYVLCCLLTFMANIGLSITSESNPNQIALGWNYAPNTNSIGQVGTNHTRSTFSKNANLMNKRGLFCDSDRTFCDGLCYTNIICCNVQTGDLCPTYATCGGSGECLCRNGTFQCGNPKYNKCLPEGYVCCSQETGGFCKPGYYCTGTGCCPDGQQCGTDVHNCLNDNDPQCQGTTVSEFCCPAIAPYCNVNKCVNHDPGVVVTTVAGLLASQTISNSSTSISHTSSVTTILTTPTATTNLGQIISSTSSASSSKSTASSIDSFVINLSTSTNVVTIYNPDGPAATHNETFIYTIQTTSAESEITSIIFPGSPDPISMTGISAATILTSSSATFIRNTSTSTFLCPSIDTANTNPCLQTYTNNTTAVQTITSSPVEIPTSIVSTGSMDLGGLLTDSNTEGITTLATLSTGVPISVGSQTQTLVLSTMTSTTPTTAKPVSNSGTTTSPIFGVWLFCVCLILVSVNL